MKKIKQIIFCGILFMFILSGCNLNDSNIKTTNLNNIFVDNIKINSNIKDVDLTKYTKSNRHSGNYTYLFDEIVLNVTNNKVDYLFSRFDENKTIISVNDKSNLIKIDEISNLLGNNFKDKWYDKEQGLKTYLYYDFENKIRANFVYSSYDNTLTWIKIESSN